MNRIAYRRLTLLPALLLLAQSGLAQQQPANTSGTASAGSSTELKEIVVTAERRVQNELTVPLALQAMTATQLAVNHITNLTDLQFTTPGFLPASGEGYTQLYIRGIGNDIFVGADPSVATFVDGVPRIYGSLDQNLVDVERVEILKGAQGGLYGRNATGGVVNIITRQPSTAEGFTGSALVDYGEMGTVRAAAWANVPVSDSVAFLFSVERDSHGPYDRNLATTTPYTAAMFPGGDALLGLNPQQTAALLNSHVHPDAGLDNGNYWATDDKMLLKPTDNLKVTLAGDYTAKLDTDGAQNLNPTASFTQANALAPYLADIGAILSPSAVVDKGASGPFTASMGDPAYVDTWDYGTSLTAVYSAPGVDITDISAYRANTTNFEAGANGGTAPDIDEEVDIHRDFAYQELRAQSTYNSPFQWIGGATYLASNVSAHTGVALLGGLVPDAADIRSVDVVHNWSVYGQGTYDFTQRLSLTVSYRYEHETNEATYTSPTAAVAGANLSKSIPSATLSYKLGDNGNVYVRWARGIKSGGVNPTTAPIYFPAGAAGFTFQPETVDTYEAGYRRALFNHRVQLTTDIFYNDYKDIQFTDHANAAYASTIILAIVNAKSARTYGAEETLDWRIAAPVTVGINWGYLDATYTNAELLNSQVLAPYDYNGKTMINSPRWQGSLTASLDQPINAKLDLIGNIMTSYISSAIFDYSEIPGVLPNAGTPAYWLTNARLGVQTSGGKYSFTLWANNLFNRVYYTYGNASTTGNVLLWGNPRVFGGEITANF